MNIKNLAGLFATACAGSIATFFSMPPAEPELFDSAAAIPMHVTAQQKSGQPASATLLIAPSLSDITRLYNKGDPRAAGELQIRLEIIRAMSQDYWRDTVRVTDKIMESGLTLKSLNDHQDALERVNDDFIRKVEDETGLTIMILDIVPTQMPAPQKPSAPYNGALPEKLMI